MQQVAVKWQSKTLRENVALRAGTYNYRPA